MTRARHGLAGSIARAFVDSKLTPLLIVASVLLGVLAPSLSCRARRSRRSRCPMVDVLVAMPGASAEEVESRVSAPLERLMWEIPGVEYVYSTSQPGRSLVVVRYRVGEDVERSLVKLLPEAPDQRRPDPAGRIFTAGQGALDRRRADPGADVPLEPLRPR